MWPPHKRTGNCKICSFFKDQQKPGRKKKTKPGIKPREDSAEPKEQVEMVEGMSGTLSFQPDPASLSFSEEVKNLQSFRGSEPLYPEQFVENIKHEYMCPICKEVLDQPVQTKCRTPHMFCASCLSFSFEMCGSLCLVCQTVIVNPNEFIEPAPFVLSTKIKPSPLVPVKPILAAEEKGPAQLNVPSVQAELTTTTGTTTTCGEQLSVNQLLTRPNYSFQ